MRGEEPSNFSVAILFPFPTLSCNLYTLHLADMSNIYHPLGMRLILTLTPSIVKCTKIKPQVDCFSSCSAHVASSVAKSDWQVSYFTLKFHISQIASHFNLLFAFLKLFNEDFSYIAIFAPYQAWANALAGPCQQEGEEGEAPSHTHR